MSSPLVTSVEGGGPPSGADLNGPVSLTPYITQAQALSTELERGLAPFSPYAGNRQPGTVREQPHISLSVMLLFMEVKELRFKQTSTQALASPLTSCVKFSKLLHLSKCLFPHL